MNNCIINQLSTSLLKWKTPYELLHGKSPEYDHLKCFGYLCYTTDTLLHKNKFAPRAVKCAFIGFSSGQKAYKLYDIHSHNIYVSRDVASHEQLFPFIPSPSNLTTLCLLYMSQNLILIVPQPPILFYLIKLLITHL